MRNSEILLAPLRNQEAVVSSRMEGTISTLDEVLQIEAQIEASESESEAEAFNRARSEAVETLLYSRSMQRLQRELSDGCSLTEFHIRAAHQILLSYGRGAGMLPGAYKTEQNYIGERRRGEISFVPISPESLPSGMQSLMRYVDDSQDNALLKVALAHVEFEALHPFKDGNGRIGRMIITLLLWQFGMLRAPHFYVSATFEEFRDEYVERMRRVSSHGEWSEWCIFFVEVMRRQAERNSETARQIFDLYENMKVRFREELNSQWAVEALDFMFANPQFRNSRFTSSGGIPPHVAMDMSRNLRAAGLIHPVIAASGRRPAVYAFSSLIDIVRG